MKAKITLFLIAAAIIFTGAHAEARVVQKQQSWIEQIFSNDSDNMIQKSPFGQPQQRQKNARQKQQHQAEYADPEEARTKMINEPDPRQNRRSRYAQKDRGQRHIESQRERRLTAIKQQQHVGVND